MAVGGKRQLAKLDSLLISTIGGRAASKIRLDRFTRFKDLQDFRRAVGSDDDTLPRDDFDKPFELQTLHGMMNGRAPHPEERRDSRLIYELPR
jgi:hypothetical protein